MSTRVRWLGHATLLVETEGHRLLIDPFLSDNPSAVAKADDVEADFILVSHGHFDHIGDAVSIARRTGAMVVTNVEIAAWLQGKGLEKVHGQQPGGGRVFPFGRLKFTQAIHGSSLPDGSYGGLACGLHLFLNDGARIYDAADTALFGDMRLIGDDGIDLAILPIGDNFTMGPDDAAKAIPLLRPRKVFPIHYNTWDVIAQDAPAWADRVRRESGIDAVALHPGDWIEV